jgi:hypothetical protein
LEFGSPLQPVQADKKLMIINSHIGFNWTIHQAVLGIIKLNTKNTSRLEVNIGALKEVNPGRK